MTYNLKQYATAIKNETRQGQNTAERIGTWMEEAANSIAEKATHTNDDGDSLVYLPKGKNSLDVYAKSQTSNGKVQYAPEDLYEKLYASSGEVELIPYNEGNSILGIGGAGLWFYENYNLLFGKYITQIKLFSKNAGTMTIYVCTRLNSSSFTYKVQSKVNLKEGMNIVSIDVQLDVDETLVFFTPSLDTAQLMYLGGVPNSVGGKLLRTDMNGGVWSVHDNNLCIGVNVKGGIGFGDISMLKQRIVALENRDDNFSLSGKKISILSHSIATFKNYIPDGYMYYYPMGDVQSMSETWWGQVIQRTGANLEVNNSFSGSSFARSQINSNRIALSDDSRLVNLGSPDIILVDGTENDFGFALSPIGEYNFEGLQDKSVFKQAVTYTILELLRMYPKAKIIIMTPIHRGDNVAYPFKVQGGKAYKFEYARVLMECSQIFGLPYIDMFECGIKHGDTDFFIDGIHPTKRGMSLMADYVIKRLNEIFNKNMKYTFSCLPIIK